jgi:hypothetical protein
VLDDQTFETVLEDRLNRENNRQKVAQYEILNFSVGNYTPLERLRALEVKALSFEPDIVFYTALIGERYLLVRRLAEKITKGTEIPYDYLKQVADEAGIKRGKNISAAVRGLQPHGNHIMSWTYHRIVELCRQRSIVPVYILMPIMRRDPAAEGVATDQLRLAQEAGFLIVDLSDLYKNKDKASLWVAEWDRHPNATAHRLVADRLYQELKRNPALLQKLK